MDFIGIAAVRNFAKIRKIGVKGGRKYHGAIVPFVVVNVTTTGMEGALRIEITAPVETHTVLLSGIRNNGEYISKGETNAVSQFDLHSTV